MTPVATSDLARFRTFDGQPLRGANAGVVRIRHFSGRGHAGMGILVGPRHVVTCAHVASTAAGYLDVRQRPPADKVLQVNFPLYPGAGTRTARCIDWVEPRIDSGDLALLELESDAPAEVGIAILAQVRGTSIWGNRLSVFGYQVKNPIGTRIEARFIDANPAVGEQAEYTGIEGRFGNIVSATRTQIDGAREGGPFIIKGYSGSAIWDVEQDAVVGMAAVADLEPGRQVAYAIAAAEIKTFLPGMPIEVRRTFPGFDLTWSILALVTLVIGLLHLLHMQGVDGINWATPWAPTRQLAKYWGMVLLAFLTPFLFALLWRHVSSLRLHDWWQRVPALLRGGAAPGVANTPLAAALTVLFFVLAPAYMLGHATWQFHDHEGLVWVNPSDFGYDRADLTWPWVCARDSIERCANPELFGIYKKLEPKLLEPGRDYFWDNAYRYGDEHFRNSVTFWPILAPAVVFFFTGIAATYLLLGVIGLLWPRPPYHRRGPGGPPITAPPASGAAVP